MSKRRKPTKAERERWNRLQDIGCVACWMLGFPHRSPDMHHLLSGGRRLGHQFTVPLCPYHHRGVQEIPFECPEILGPSLAKAPRAFRESFGDDDTLYSCTEALLAGVDVRRSAFVSTATG